MVPVIDWHNCYFHCFDQQKFGYVSDFALLLINMGLLLGMSSNLAIGGCLYIIYFKLTALIFLCFLHMFICMASVPLDHLNSLSFLVLKCVLCCATQVEKEIKLLISFQRVYCIQIMVRLMSINSGNVAILCEHQVCVALPLCVF